MDVLTAQWLRAIDYDDFHEERFAKRESKGDEQKDESHDSSND